MHALDVPDQNVQRSGVERWDLVVPIANGNWDTCLLEAKSLMHGRAAWRHNPVNPGYRA
jgi:hypothetical protein